MKKFLIAIALALASGQLYAIEPPAFVGPPVFKAVESAKPLCSCGPDCACKPGDCPGKCPLAGERSAVSVHVSMGNATAHGSGTVIASEDGKSLVLTNAHVVESANYPITVVHTDADGQPWRYPATYIGGSSVSQSGNMLSIAGPDLALLQVDYSLPAAEIADSIPASGTPVQLWGFGGSMSGSTPTHRTGQVTTHGFADAITASTLRTINGDSGAGVFTEDGKLVAVHWGGNGVALSVRLDVVHTFTVSTIEKRGVFKNFKNRLAARKINKAINSLGWLPEPPSAKPKAPVAGPTVIPAGTLGSPCANGKCPNQTYSRRRR